MVDPYATRRPDLSGRPAGPPAWAADVERLGGAPVGAGGGLDGDCAFAVVPCRGIGTLAPVAMVEPPLGVLLWLEHVADPRGGDPANRLLARLDALDRPILAVKHGSVGGPPDRPGCVEVGAGLVATVLEALDAVVWERDPDFGYLVPAAVPGLADPEARVLMPRLLYADNDRVYEHAGLVADKQRERRAIAAAAAGLDPRVGAASRWPPSPTGERWRD
ncbi:MAG: hypothetical protein BroJett022_07630 [Actinomycetes bacterium]|nr:MAG: hypothetical protein BroJett022_07630 [Actinomycetes bacterium]